MHEVFFCQFSNPCTLRVSGMGGYTSKCEKSQNHCTLLYRLGKHAKTIRVLWTVEALRVYVECY